MLVDEMLVYAGAPHGLWGMTAKVRYWLRKPIPVGPELTLRGRLVQRSDRGFRAVVSVHLPDGSWPPRARACASSGRRRCAPVSLCPWRSARPSLATPFVTTDGSTIRSLLDLSNAPVANQSLAEATIAPGESTVRHYHRVAEEIYYLVQGTGEMEIDGERRCRWPSATRS